MDKRRWAHILCAAGVVVSVIGASSYLQHGILRYNLTALCLFFGSSLTAASTLLAKSHHRTLTYGALGLAATSALAWLAYSVWSTVPGRPYSMFFDGLVQLLYILGLFAGLTAALVVLLEFFRAWIEVLPVDSCKPWSRILAIVGLTVTVIGVLAIAGPLRGWGGIAGGFWYVLLGLALAALGGYLGGRPHRKVIYGVLLLITSLYFLLLVVETLDGMGGGSF